VIDTELNQLPRRQTDSSYVIRVQDGDGERAQAFKMSAELQQPILLHRCVDASSTCQLRADGGDRQGGVEKQWRLNCARCGLCVGYQTSGPPMRSGKYMYILEGALSLGNEEDDERRV
jgi:hypothetical protein